MTAAAKQVIKITVQGSEAGSAAGAPSLVSSTIVLPRRGHAVTAASSNIVEIHVSPTFEVLAAAKNALLGLIDARDFLGFQLSQAAGTMPDEAFEALADKYLQTCDWNESRLTDLVEALVHLLGDRVDSDLVSVAFKCEIDVAERALRAAAQRMTGNRGMRTATRSMLGA
jgi:hypothetical protein